MSNVHQKGDLQQLQSLPLEAKIRLTKERIRAWYEAWWRYEIEDKKTGKIRFVTIDRRDYSVQPKIKETEFIKSASPGSVYVSFSGGKDSTVLKHIVDSMYDDVPSVFVNTGLEYPEIQKFAMSQKNVVTVIPEMRFDQVLKKYGYPVISKEISQKIHDYRKKPDGYMKERFENNHRGVAKYKALADSDIPVSHMCCNIMKKRPAKKYEKETGRKMIVGTLANESALRKTNWIRNGCNAFDVDRPRSAPMSFWTEQDILYYIKKYDIQYCSVYGEIKYKNEDELTTTGCDRTGCIFCMFGCHLEKEPNRFQKLKKTHQRQYEYCINGGEFVDGKLQPNKEGLGLKHILDYIGVKY